MQLENEESRWTGEENFEMMQKEVNLRREVLNLIKNINMIMIQIFFSVCGFLQWQKNLFIP